MLALITHIGKIMKGIIGTLADVSNQCSFIMYMKVHLESVDKTKQQRARHFDSWMYVTVASESDPGTLQ
jgi:hypothetical protein